MTRRGGTVEVVTAIPTLDALLQAHATQLGADFTGYRNHAYRVANLCAAQLWADEEQREKIAIAVAFHDLGIWTDHTFDYLQSSTRLASSYLTSSGRSDWVPEITEMILQHHKVFRYRSNPKWLVEPFRRADWAMLHAG